jgi:hypothetical protein
MSDDLAHRRDRPLKAEPDTRAANRSVVSVRDTPHAPIVFFEWAPASGFANGIVSVTLGANCNTQVRSNGEVTTETLVVAHLVQRPGSPNLRKALDNALSLAARGPVPKGKTN